ncbi:50S ribosomal subunit protein L15 [Talaromyces proteolyticus]|uniref:50S ribosomal subunit protein L15 n=1 Tax=Talaromyces proteolyticus TaxID=1131652 RepID=A0AAD4L3S9_9EURO|nr:50S ribosomal subunit protein L15 [Talaromyces proteolyticus]KAH8704094.1 50S ribosomal subunit protein L15 [Talaromyces proteolyticus]
MATRLPTLSGRLSHLSLTPNITTSYTPLSFLTPQLRSQHRPQQQTQARHASILNTLSDNPGAYNKRIRRGRGPASGKGKTSGRGHKGQKQHGKVPAGFNGGQTKDIDVHGTRGEKNIFALDLAVVNLDRIQEWIDQGRINPKFPITIRELHASKCLGGIKDGVKLLAWGKEQGDGNSTSILKQPIHLVVSRASADAIAAVEAAGGSITTRFYTRASIARIIADKTHPFYSMAWSAEKSGSEFLARALFGQTSGPEEGESAVHTEKKVMQRGKFLYRLPDPSNRRDIEYYRDPAHRGYLSHLVQPNESPSLFFLSPAHRKSTAGVKKEKVLGPNRLW